MCLLTAGRLEDKPILEFIENTMPVYNGEYHIDSRDGIIIANDFHAPYHSVKWCNRLLKIAKLYKIKQLLIAGDGLDMHSFSGWGADPDMSWNEEMSCAAEWLWVLYNSFDKIYWTRGNHEDRLARATNWQMSADNVIDSILCKYARENSVNFKYDCDKIEYSVYPFSYVDEDWMIVHPKTYSRIPNRVSSQLALTHKKHVIMAHSHRACWGWADDREHIVIDSGGMFDESKCQYRHLSITTHGGWNNGFVVYRNNYAVLFGEYPFTDWRVYE